LPIFHEGRQEKNCLYQKQVNCPASGRNDQIISWLILQSRYRRSSSEAVHSE